MITVTCDARNILEKAKKLSDGYISERAAEIDRTEQYPWDIVERFVDAGIMGMTLPREYGGRGLSYLDAVLVIEEIARSCAACGRIVVESNMGAIGAIMKYGTETQKRKAAELVLAGDKPAICITEPAAGSAAREMTTTAVKKGDRYILNGRKHWITGGGVSKLHLVFAKIIEDGVEIGIGGFIAIRGESKGLVIGKREPAMGVRGIPETEIICDDLEIAAEMLLTPPEGIGRGFASLMTAYNGQRVGAGTVAMGIARGAFEHALRYAKSRRQFGRPIAEFQGLQWLLADMSIALEASRNLLHQAAMSNSGGFPDMQKAAQAKILASENAVKITNDALQIHGAVGYSRNLPLERMARDARMFTIAGGTAQILRTQVASAILDMKTPQTRLGYQQLTGAT